MRRRNRRYSGTKKPIAMSSVWTAAVGAIALLLMWAFLSVLAFGSIGSPRIVGGIAMLVMVASIVALFVGTKTFRNDNFSTISRVLGLVLPAIATVAWLLLYCIGILFG